MDTRYPTIIAVIGNIFEKEGNAYSNIRIDLTANKHYLDDNTATLELVNLTPATVDEILSKTPLGITIYADYDRTPGLVFVGECTKQVVTRTNTKRKLTLTMIDGAIGAGNTSFYKSYEGKISTYDILSDLIINMRAQGSRVTIGKIPKSTDMKVLNHGFSNSSTSANALSHICKVNKLVWNINDNKLYVTKRHEVDTSNEPVSLVSVATGLLGHAEAYNAIEKGTDTYIEKKGIKFKTLLNSNINIDKEIQVESADYSGNFIVDEISITASNKGKMIMEVVAVNEWLECVQKLRK